MEDMSSSSWEGELTTGGGRLGGGLGGGALTMTRRCGARNVKEGANVAKEGLGGGAPGLICIIMIK
jgi:hypothetical protein